MDMHDLVKAPITHSPPFDRVKWLRNQLQSIVQSNNLEAQRQLISEVAKELALSELDCAAALLCLVESGNEYLALQPQIHKVNVVAPVANSFKSAIRLVRYRLDVGSQHQLSLDELKKILVEESGVDVNNIVNVRILDNFTLIDLPDEMPQEIFHHLKEIEINGQRLAIRRVKPRNKKRGNRNRTKHGHLQRQVFSKK